MLLLLLALQDLGAFLRQFEEEDLVARDRAGAAILERWKDWTEEDLGRLRKASASADQEVAGRAGDLLKRVLLRRALGSGPLARFKDLEKRVESAEERPSLLREAAVAWRLAELPTEEVRALARVLADRGAGIIEHDEDVLENIIPPFLPLLRNDFRDPECRVHAAEAALACNAREYLPEMRTLLKESEPSLRIVAARALVDWGEKVDPGLIRPLLSHKGARERSAALRLLVDEDAGRILPMLRDPSPDVREAAIGALAASGVKEAAEGIATLLGDSNVEVRVAAIGAFRHLGAPAPVDAILASVDGLGGYPRQRAWEEIRELKPEAFQEKILAHATRPETRSWGAWETLLGLGPALRVKPLEWLERGDEAVRQTLIHVVSNRRRSATLPLFPALLNDRDSNMRSQAAADLGRAGAREHAAAVAELLTDPDPVVRMEAAEALFRLGARSEIPRIAKLLQDPAVETVNHAAQVLGWMGAREHAKDIAALLQPDLEQPTLLTALADLGAREHAGAVAARLKGNSRGRAARALAALAPERWKEILPLLKDEDPYTVRTAMEILGEIGSDEAVRALEGMLESGEGTAAARALLETGRPEVPAKVSRFLAEADRVWFAWSLAEWTARGVRPEDRDRLSKLSLRMSEDFNDALRSAGRLTQVGLGLAEPASLKDILLSCERRPLFRVLSAAHAREAVAKLHRPFELKKDVASLEALQEAVRDALGVRLEVEDHLFSGFLPAGTRVTGLGLIDRLMQRAPHFGAYLPETGIVADGDVIRVMYEERAVAYWERKLGASPQRH